MALTVPPTLSVIVSIWMETLFYGMSIMSNSSLRIRSSADRAHCLLLKIQIGINIMVYFLCIYDLLFVREYASKTTKRLLVSLSTLLSVASISNMC